VRGKILSIVVLAVIVTGIFATGCAPTPQDVDRQAQQDILSNGQAVEPVYQTQNFLARGAINEWAKRMDTPDKLWYVYEYADSGVVLGYYISRTVPLSYGVSLTNPERMISGAASMPAPGVDGVFYTGVDEDLYFFFDAETDTLIMTNNRLKILDMPLDIDAPLFRFKQLD